MEKKFEVNKKISLFQSVEDNRRKQQIDNVC